MTKRYLQGVFALFLAAACVFSGGCGRKSEYSTASPKVNIDNYTYEFTDAEFNLSENCEYTELGSDSDGIYCLKSDKSGADKNYSFSRLKFGDSKPEEKLLDSGNLKYENLVTGDNGCFYAVRTMYPDRMVSQIDSDDVSLGKGTKRLIKYSASGDEIWAVPLTIEDDNGYIVDI